MADPRGKIDGLEHKINNQIFGTDTSDNFENDTKEISNSINKIIDQNKSYTTPNMMDFLNASEFNNDANMSGEKPKKKFDKGQLEKVLSKENLSQLMGFEKERISRYSDYSIIYSYIPQLAECINVYRDSIMSPDDLTKDSLNIRYKSDKVKDELSNDVIKNTNFLVKKYKLNKRAKNIIRKALTLGDYFVAVLRYDEEFNKMLLTEDNKDLFNSNNEEQQNSRFIMKEDIDDKDLKMLFETNLNEKSEYNYNQIKSEISSVINNNIDYEDDPRKSLLNLSADGLSQLNKKKNKENDEDEFTHFGIKGSIIRMLSPENVIKLEVDGINFGYIHIEKTDEIATQGSGTTAISDFFNSRVDIEQSNHKDREEIIANVFIKGISKKIDNEFIKDNKEFKDYIYALLKEKYITEKKVKITYLAPDEVVHFMTDSDELYGQSKLARSLFFAKLYLATLITELMQKISRGRDKRLVYVETGLDADIEGAIQGVVKDIKSKEIQTDILKSVSTILNSIGVFDDYYIPLIDGEKPLDFDTLSGMDVDADSDFLQFLLKSAVNGTGVPANYIDASQDVDFARSLVMQNSTFVRTIVSDQASFSESFSELIRILYRNEYHLNDNRKDKDNGKKKKDSQDYIDVNDIEVLFPPPISLNLTNINDQISNASQTVDFITSSYIDETDADTSKKTSFKKKIVRQMIPNIDWDLMDRLYEDALMDSTENALKTNNSEGDGGDLGGGF
ncbi:hypothetical protein Goe21_01430 [Bacillus phage vB_BsuM-Goe21]|nr:hypothetical protein Goe21_01430 [Bacillus phage vB_BsuM-Goe21]